MKKDKKYCVGCRENFYNGNNPMGIKECWCYKSARVVSKWCIGWWTSQDKKENFWETTTLTCHTETGNIAFYDKLPAHLS
jgi:hypothetical protein